jgi:hypothetical protein
MALGIYFAVQGMTAEKFAAVHEQLAAIDPANPPGRTFHAGFHVGNGIHVFDVWESQETFEAFGQHLMPILAENGIDPGEPRIGEIELVMTPGVDGDWRRSVPAVQPSPASCSVITQSPAGN